MIKLEKSGAPEPTECYESPVAPVVREFLDMDTKFAKYTFDDNETATKVYQRTSAYLNYHWRKKIRVIKRGTTLYLNNLMKEE